MKHASLICGFLQSAEDYPDRSALYVEGRYLTYAELHSLAARIAVTLLEQETGPTRFAAILASRSVTAYAGILGILAAGIGYVPLNPKFPPARTRQMLRLSGCRLLVVGSECLSQLPRLLSEVNERITVVLPDQARMTDLAAALPQHHLIATNSLATEPGWQCVRNAAPDAVAFLLFTSGSTGEPKGVPVSHRNVRSYVEYICSRYDVNENDRFSQEFELTFDLSVHDMFVCWERGACLYCIPQKAVMLPAKFIQDHKLTLWFSVPSVASLLARTHLLRPGRFPSLRFSLFCGEPLAAAYAQQWQEAAPNSIVENLYGPTEATIAISAYRWRGQVSVAESHNGIAPIGFIFEGQRGCVIDNHHAIVSDGAIGELCVAGSQVTSGYWNNDAKSQEQFIRLREMPDTIWYRTGDLVKRDERGCLYFLGRIDQQVKIRGYRVELQEVEAVLRKACCTEQVVCLGWPVSNGSPEGIVGFISGPAKVDMQSILNYCREVLPEYMVPTRIYSVPQLPLGINGKVDRTQLGKMLEGM